MKEKPTTLVTSGEYPRAKGIPEQEIQALMHVIMTIYNLDEAIVKG